MQHVSARYSEVTSSSSSSSSSWLCWSLLLRDPLGGSTLLDEVRCFSFPASHALRKTKSLGSETLNCAWLVVSVFASLSTGASSFFCNCWLLSATPKASSMPSVCSIGTLTLTPDSSMRILSESSCTDVSLPLFCCCLSGVPTLSLLPFVIHCTCLESWLGAWSLLVISRVCSCRSCSKCAKRASRRANIALWSASACSDMT
mmetsp:Transcript_21143/g.48538  ORF Transcript_21143/g.48538 Transcript_21143/m.48538 type:complete len:202 (-) Transcript_21143:42-647(-)